MKKICKLSDIDDGTAQGFDIELEKGTFAIVCARFGKRVFAYKNSCPHTGVNLEWLPNQFLDDTKQYFVCSTHGAMFEIENGYCITGPCQGDSLTPLVVKIEEGDIFCGIS